METSLIDDLTKLSLKQNDPSFIVKALKTHLYAKYAERVILHRESAKAAAKNSLPQNLPKPITSNIINSIRDDYSFQSPFRKLTTTKKQPKKQVLALYKTKRGVSKSVKVGKSKKDFIKLKSGGFKDLDDQENLIKIVFECGTLTEIYEVETKTHLVGGNTNLNNSEREPISKNNAKFVEDSEKRIANTEYIKKVLAEQEPSGNIFRK